MSHAPIITSTLDQGALAILDLLARTPGGGPSGPSVIGITGPVGAGKSTLASMLASATPACIISTDHYLPDYCETPEHRRDLPESADLARLLADLQHLRSGVATDIPQWCFQHHKRVGTLRIDPQRLIIVEGLHALHQTHAVAVDLRVFVDAPANVRWARWEHLERTGVRGWGVEYARAFFDCVAEPTFRGRAAAYRKGAHVIVRNDTAHEPEPGR